MSSAMADLFRERIAAGLRKKSIRTASAWAEENRIMKEGRWSFRNFPWLKEMHDSQAESNVGQKGAQLGFSETMLNLTFFNIDVLRRDCLYVLPAKNPDSADFSAGRFGPALELSKYLASMFHDVQNVGHKRAGNVNLYIRGSKSRAGLKSVPAGFLVLDELDEMTRSAIALAKERQSGQASSQDWKISTPTFEGEGINSFYKTSTEEHYHFKCPSCSKLITLEFPESLVIVGQDPNDPRIEESHLICKECKVVLPHEAKPDIFTTGRWVPSRSNTSVRGFHVSQLYSTVHACRPAAIAAQFLRSLADNIEEQEFFNSKLGLPHVVKGARVTDEDINNCIGGHVMHRPDTPYNKRGDKILTMGVDVGRMNHCVVLEWDFPKENFGPGVNVYTDPNSKAHAKLIWAGKVESFGELDELMITYGIHFAIIDSQPERRLSYQFVQRFYNYTKMCFYVNGITSRQTVPSPEQDQAINCDRTSWLDMTLGRFFRGKKALTLPMDIDSEYRENLKAQIKLYSKDKAGNSTSTYITGANKQDHYGHAQNYAEMALPFALGKGTTESFNLQM